MWQVTWTSLRPGGYWHSWMSATVTSPEIDNDISTLSQKCHWGPLSCKSFAMFHRTLPHVSTILLATDALSASLSHHSQDNAFVRGVIHLMQDITLVPWQPDTTMVFSSIALWDDQFNAELYQQPWASRTIFSDAILQVTWEIQKDTSLQVTVDLPRQKRQLENRGNKERSHPKFVPVQLDLRDLVSSCSTPFLSPPLDNPSPSLHPRVLERLQDKWLPSSKARLGSSASKQTWTVCGQLVYSHRSLCDVTTPGRILTTTECHSSHYMLTSTETTRPENYKLWSTL